MKVAIIGAGINGLYIGWKLAEKGENITIFEKKGEIGKKVCSGLFSEKILKFIPGSKNLVKNKIDFALIHFPKKTLRVSFSEKFLVIEHAELDKLAASLAEKAGANIVLNSQIESFPKEFDRIIGCDGVFSSTRKILGLVEPKLRLGMQGLVLRSDNSNFVETWPTKSGFIWKIPRGNAIEWGIIEKPKKAKKLFDDFLNKKNISLPEIKSALIPQGLTIPNNKKITLCGDAAGLTKPWSGGGVVWGLFAADLLLKNFPDFLKYQKEAKKAFWQKIIFSKIITKMVYFSGFNIPYLLPGSFQIEGDFLTYGK